MCVEALLCEIRSHIMVKYVVYTNCKLNDLQQSNEIKGSYHMEKEGLHRCMDFLQDHNLAIDVLVTNRQKQINKWIRETHPHIKHYFNTWHVAKGTY